MLTAKLLLLLPMKLLGVASELNEGGRVGGRVGGRAFCCKFIHKHYTFVHSHTNNWTLAPSLHTGLGMKDKTDVAAR